MKDSMCQKYKHGEITKSQYMNYCAVNRGFKNYLDYFNHLAVKKGFKNDTDRRKKCSHKNGSFKPLGENKACSTYLGVYIAERVLSKIFDNVERMPYGNKGYDFLCPKGFKIDVKSSCNQSSGKYHRWSFPLKHNKTADYFLLIAFDNRTDLNPMYIWLVKNDVSMDKSGITITDSKKVLTKWKPHEQTDKLNDLIRCCESIKTK